MKKIILFIITVFSMTLSCADSPIMPEYTGERLEVNFKYTKRAGFFSNQYAVWIEDNNGNYITTIHVTEDMFKKDLYKKREQALKNWKEKVDINSISNSEIDGFSHATPKVKSSSLKYAWDLKDKNGVRVANGYYKFSIEGTIYKDHNVVYSGTINISDNMSDLVLNAKANYSSDEAKLSDMITEVSAKYFKN